MNVRRFLLASLIAFSAFTVAHADENRGDPAVFGGLMGTRSIVDSPSPPKAALLAKSERCFIHAVTGSGSNGERRTTVTVTSLATGRMEVVLASGTFFSHTHPRNFPMYFHTRLLGIAETALPSKSVLWLLVYRSRTSSERNLPSHREPNLSNVLPNVYLHALDPRTGKRLFVRRFTSEPTEPTRDGDWISIPKTASFPDSLPAETIEAGMLEGTEDGLKVFGCTLVLDENGHVERVLGPGENGAGRE
ncbi:MAG: hypothetical protein WD069_01330 [Planctomycetales bacterium]